MDPSWVGSRWGSGDARRFVGEWWFLLLLSIGDEGCDVGSASSVWVGVENIRNKTLGISMNLLR